MKYESPTSFGSKVMAKVKFFQKKVKSRGQGHEVKNVGIGRKVLSKGIHLCNIKALSPFVKKLWSMLSLLWTDEQTARVISIYPPKLCLREYDYQQHSKESMSHQQNIAL